MSNNEGEAMERAEEAITRLLAQTCQTPTDYAVFGEAGRTMVDHARDMTQAQRALFLHFAKQEMEVLAKIIKAGTGDLPRSPPGIPL